MMMVVLRTTSKIEKSSWILLYSCGELVHRRRNKIKNLPQNACHVFMTRTRDGEASVYPIIAVEPVQHLKLHLVVRWIVPVLR